MPASSSRPVIAVLCERATDRPPGLDDLPVDFRYCAADGLDAAVRGARALMLWDFFSTAVRDVWSEADSLEWIHVTAAGVDTLLFDELRDSAVVVTNAHGVFDRPIAEYVLGAVIAHAKDSLRSFDLQRDHEWQHRETRSILGAKALIVGTGAIGRATARLLRAAGLEVRGAGRVARGAGDVAPGASSATRGADSAGRVADSAARGADSAAGGADGPGRGAEGAARGGGQVASSAESSAWSDSGPSGDPDFGEIVASSNLAAEVGWADHVVLAAPLTDVTRGLVDADVFAAMRPGTHIVNVARGPIVDETALLAALGTGRIAATLDVFDQEPLPAGHPLWDAPNVTITAHMSGDVIGWRDTLAAQFAANVRRWLAGEPLLNVVDKKLGYVPTGDR